LKGLTVNEPVAPVTVPVAVMLAAFIFPVMAIPPAPLIPVAALLILKLSICAV